MTDLIILPIKHTFKVGDHVIDRTAVANDWPDMYGMVVDVDGSNIKVKYGSDNERWKMHTNLVKREV